MFKLNGMLMIGSAGSNVGKTKLACALLRKFNTNGDIIGIKVTTIKDKDGQCPRGGKGCGVCSSLEGVYRITEEFNNTSNKDTARLLAAGAKRVFWLCVLKDHLQEGTRALLDVIGPDAVSICESNSLRHIVEPDLFLMIKSRKLETWKKSAQLVKKYVDRIIVSNGSGFDFDLNRIKLLDNRWTLQTEATAIIMAGGSSSRMGTDKSMLSIKGQSMIEAACEQLRGRFDEIIISANSVDKFAFLGFEVVPDQVPGQGPLMGIASALEASANEFNFVVACDIPKINLSCVNRMLAMAVESQADIIVPTTGEGKYEPLFAIYRQSALKAINSTLSSGKRKITDAFALCRVKYVKLENANWLVNLNTIAEYENYQKEQSDEL